MQPLQQVVKQMWNVPIVPGMNTGASDAVFTNAAGMPTYGITAIGIDVDDVRAHGRDERVRTTSFYEGLDFYYRFLKALTGASAAQ
jgi:acetylornithine deacetylase/succinyl-diaminopimelate desuccinylase-like protein